MAKDQIERLEREIDEAYDQAEIMELHLHGAREEYIQARQRLESLFGEEIGLGRQDLAPMQSALAEIAHRDLANLAVRWLRAQRNLNLTRRSVHIRRRALGKAKRAED